MNDGMYSSIENEWGTPQELFNRLNEVFHFNLDVCANRYNRKCNEYYGYGNTTNGEFTDGLLQSWEGKICFMNPPYGRYITNWVRKAQEESQKPGTIVVGLLPARTDTQWFHKYCTSNTDIGLIVGRLKFEIPGKTPSAAPFPSMLVVWDGAVSRYYRDDMLSLDNIYWVREIIL